MAKSRLLTKLARLRVLLANPADQAANALARGVAKSTRGFVFRCYPVNTLSRAVNTKVDIIVDEDESVSPLSNRPPTSGLWGCCPSLSKWNRCLLRSTAGCYRRTCRQASSHTPKKQILCVGI